MGEYLTPKEVLDRDVSNNPYLRAIQVANRLGLMGVDIETIDRTFPLGMTDLLGVITDDMTVDSTYLATE